jgi:hypothetical protein
MWAGDVLNGKLLLTPLGASREFAPQFATTGETRQQAIDDSIKHWKQHVVDEARGDAVSREYDSWAGGSYGSARFQRDWEFWGGSHGPDMFKMGGHVYRIINIPDADHFFVAKDDDEEWMKFGGSAPSTFGVSLFVTDQEDVYVVGGTDGNGRRNLVWKNGAGLAYGENAGDGVVGDGDITGARFEHVWVWEKEVFVAGRHFRTAPQCEEKDRRPQTLGMKEFRRIERLGPGKWIPEKLNKSLLGTSALMLNGKVIAEK